MNFVRQLAVALAIMVCGLFASAAQAQDWKEMQSRDGGFSVLLPGPSSYSKQAVEGGLGELTWHNYSAETKQGDCGWLVSYVEFPARYVEQWSEKEILDFHISQLRGTYRVRSVQSYSQSGISGRELRLAEDFEGSHYEHWMRVFLNDRRLYKLHIASRSSLPLAREIGKFADSFRWLSSRNDE